MTAGDSNIGDTDAYAFNVAVETRYVAAESTPEQGRHVFAYTIANDRPHPFNEPFSLERFATGHLIDEHGAAGVAH